MTGDLLAPTPILPDKPDFDQWVTAGRILTQQHTGLHWLIGDWVAYGAEHWADRWLTVASTIGIPHATIVAAAEVAHVFPADRRRDGLSWSHHRAVIRCDDQDRDRWLDQAAENGWTARRLETEIRDAHALEGDGQDELDGMPTVPRFDRSAAARLLADGVRYVRVDLVTGTIEPEERNQP